MIKQITLQNETKAKINKILIFLAGFLVSACYGIMLGWPSPTYPKLLSEGSELPITLPQTALIAGMLMDGYTLTIPLGGLKIIPNKPGLILSFILITSGWIIIYFAKSVLTLCLGRLLIGLGSGFGISKFKFYFKIINTDNNFKIIEFIPVFISIGILISYCFGPFLSFQIFTIMAAAISIMAILPTLFLPIQNPPVETVDNKIENKTKINYKNLSLFTLFKNKTDRNNLFLFFVIMTIQQFSGAPAINVYSQIIFKEFGYSFPFLFCISYMLLQIINTYLGIKYIHDLKRKPVLIVTLVILTFSMFAAILYLYYKPNGAYFIIIPIVIMSFYVTFHTIGLATVPIFLINDLFDSKHYYFVSCVFQMYTAQLAVFITKIFQVFFTEYKMYVGFCFLASVNCVGLIFVTFFFEESKNWKSTTKDKSIELGLDTQGVQL